MAIKRKDIENNKVVVDKLRNDVNNKLIYWLKKVPRYNELIVLIADAEDNLQNCDVYISELKDLKALFNINKTKSFIIKSKENEVEYLKKLNESPEFINLLAYKKELKQNISLVTPHWYVKQIENYRNNLTTTSNLQINEIKNFDDVVDVKVDKQLDEYNSLMCDIAKIFDCDVMLVYPMKINTIKNKLTDVFSSMQTATLLKRELVDVEIKITKLRNSLGTEKKLTDIIYTAFGDIKEPKTEKIVKEILFSANILNVYAISAKACLKSQCTHIVDDAVGFGLEGLLKAINKWYETQLLGNEPLCFNGFMYQYINFGVVNGLQDLNYSGMIKSSNLNTIRNKNKAEIDVFLKKNPQYSHLDNNEIFEMLLPHSKTMKRVSSVNNESTITEHITINNSDSDPNNSTDVYTKNYDEQINSSEMLEAKAEYKKMIDSLNKIFETKKHVVYDYNSFNEPLYEETTEKLFTVYDRELLLMDIGFKFKHKTNKAFTLDEMSDVLKEMYKQNGIHSNRFGEPISFGTSTISVRLKKIRENIKLALQYDPTLINGFEYFVTVIDGGNFRMKNVEKLGLMSNDRENINRNI